MTIRQHIRLSGNNRTMIDAMIQPGEGPGNVLDCLLLLAHLTPPDLFRKVRILSRTDAWKQTAQPLIALTRGAWELPVDLGWVHDQSEKGLMLAFDDLVQEAATQ